MATFKDGSGREWEIVFDAKKLHHIRTECEVDLTAQDGKDFERIADDPYLFFNLLWFILKTQASKYELDEDAFAAVIVGETTDTAAACLLKAITDFFSPSKSNLLKAITEENAALRELATAKAMAKVADPKTRARVLEAIEQKMDQEVEKVLTRLCSPTSTPGS